MASPQVQLNSASLGGWTTTENGINVALGELVSVRLVDSAGVRLWNVSVFSAGGDVLAPTVTQASTPTGSATFTAPATPTDGWALLFQSVVGIPALGKDASFTVRPDYKTTFGVFTLTAAGGRVFASNETTESSAAQGWAKDMTALAKAPPGAGGPPTGSAAGDWSGTFPSGVNKRINQQYVPWKSSVRAVVTTNVSTASMSVTQDGITLVQGDRVLLAAQSTASQNGIYAVGTVGGGNAPLTRSSDMSASQDTLPGSKLHVYDGSIWANTEWTLTTQGAITLGATSLQFTPDRALTIAALRLVAGKVSGEIVSVPHFATPGDGGGGDFAWKVGTQPADDVGINIVPSVTTAGWWQRRYSGAVHLEWFGAKADVVFSTCATTSGSRTITVPGGIAAKAVVGQTISVRGAFSSANATCVNLTGVTTNVAAGVPKKPPTFVTDWPYAIAPELFTLDQTLLCPLHLHRYIEIGSYSGYVSDIGGLDHGTTKRSPLAAGYNRLSLHRDDGSEPPVVAGATGKLGGDNWISTIESINVGANTITLAAGGPAASITFARTDVAFGTDCAAALAAAQAAGKEVVPSRKFWLGPYTNNTENATWRFTRGGQFVNSGELASNGNRFHVIGHTQGITDGNIDPLAEFVYVGPVKGICLHPAAGTPPAGPTIQSSEADLWENFCVRNIWFTPHMIGMQIGQNVEVAPNVFAAYGMGGGKLINPIFQDCQAGAGIALFDAYSTQQFYCEGLRVYNFDPGQQGSGGNLGRGYGLRVGVHGPGACTASWFTGGTIQGVCRGIYVESADTCKFSNFVQEDNTFLNGLFVMVNAGNSIEVTGFHEEDVPDVPTNVDPISNANRNRFMRLGQEQTNIHAQFAAGAPINATTALTQPTCGPRLLRVVFGSGTRAASVVTVTGTDYTGNVLVAAFPRVGTAVSVNGGDVNGMIVTGYGLDLFATVTSITSNIDPGVTVDVLQVGHTATDVTNHNHLRIATQVIYERISSDGFRSYDNQILVVNENATYPGVYFLATDSGSFKTALYLEDPEIQMGPTALHLANSSFVGVTTVTGLITHTNPMRGGEYPPRVDNTDRPAYKFGGGLYPASAAAMVIDSRTTDGVQHASGSFLGTWAFAAATTFNGQSNFNAAMVGLALPNFSMTLQTGAMGTFKAGHTAGLAVTHSNPAVASGNPYGDGSNVLQQTLLQLSGSYWDPTGTPQERASIFQIFPQVTTRATTPAVDCQFTYANAQFDFYHDANGDSISWGGGTAPRVYSGAGVPNFSAPFGSIYLRTGGGANTSHYVNEGAGGGGSGNNWVAK